MALDSEPNEEQLRERDVCIAQIVEKVPGEEAEVWKEYLKTAQFDGRGWVVGPDGYPGFLEDLLKEVNKKEQ